MVELKYSDLSFYFLFHAYVFKTFVTRAVTVQISSSDMAPLTSEELAAIEDEDVLNKMVSR